ncbi:MAG: hypothetical protein BZ136_09555 [Methanosphaera sp. rholeuAM74]|nr:MAG: hypothetical protein BZ136_09555 [Methanosphaera sp. rholeuAM74]
MLLENDTKLLRRWKLKNGLADETFRVYKSSIKGYIKATGMTLTELYEEAITEEEQHIPRYRKSINDHILEYREYLEKTSNSESTKNRAMRIVASFYNHMDIDYPRMPRQYNREPDPENVEKMITKELIQRMMEMASIRDKAVISFAALTGQSPEEMRNITIQQVIDSWNTKLEQKLWKLEDIFKQRDQILEIQCSKLKLIRNKTKNRYWVYLTNETSKYIIDYLYERCYGFNKKQRPHGMNDYLFVAKDGNQFKRSAIGKIFTELGRKSGFETPEIFPDKLRLLLERQDGKHRVWKAYNFRKYFINTCRRYAGTRMDSKTEYVFSGRELADFWVGHVPQGSIKYYLQYNQDDVDEMEIQFMQAFPFLSLEVEVDSITTQDKAELENLKLDYANMQKQLHDLQEYIKSKEKFEQLSKNFGI